MSDIPIRSRACGSESSCVEPPSNPCPRTQHRDPHQPSKSHFLLYHHGCPSPASEQGNYGLVVVRHGWSIADPRFVQTARTTNPPTLVSISSITRPSTSKDLFRGQKRRRMRAVHLRWYVNLLFLATDGVVDPLRYRIL